MKAEAKRKRENEIETAAYRVLSERGYSGTSMLEVAKEAKASNETLYRWYGDKRGLFASMVVANAADAKAELEAALTEGGDDWDRLRRLGFVLLTTLLNDKTVLLHRAAAADQSCELGWVMAESGRDTITATIQSLIEKATSQSGTVARDSSYATEMFFGILLGDLQIRRIIGVIPLPDGRVIEDRSEFAVSAIRSLYQEKV